MAGLAKAHDDGRLLTHPDPRRGVVGAGRRRLRLLAWRDHRLLPGLSRPGSVGAQLPAASVAAGAILIVTGAYTQSRVRQMLGGVTRHVLQHAKALMLMAAR